MKYGLIGGSLKHSYSKLIHRELGDYDYDLYPLDENKLEAFVQEKSLNGYNVTIPYKKQIIEYMDFVDSKARLIGAVNTVVNRDGRLYGYNTDFDGMVYMLKDAGIDIKDKVVMILGSGGTSNTAQAVAKSLGAKRIIVVSRSGEVDYTNYHQEKHTQIVINTTPVGMYPDVDACPIDIAIFPELLAVADVVYNPENTLFIDSAKRLGLKTAKGLTMLVAQAKYASELFFDKKIDDAVINRIVKEQKRKSKNLVLIGMPGSGKTTIAKKVADRLEKTFVDIDEEIERREGLSIPEIFAKYGEQYFRDLEKSITLDFSKQTGLVISTGGGIVKDPANRPILHLNGVVIEVFRPLEELATVGRPLSKDAEAVAKLYKERVALYEDFRDELVVNDSSIEKAIEGVLEKYENSCN